MNARVAVLFARRDSVYKTIPGCDVFDADRDARTYAGSLPVVSHPPCRSWGRLRSFARPAPGERDLAFFAVDRVRDLGGVLEHPESSSLWAAAELPRPGDGTDSFGGWTLPVDQWWWGHRARKATWLYVVGVRPAELPVMPYAIGEASHVVASSRRELVRPSVSKAEREATPVRLAHWLVDLACRSSVVGVAA